jgi:hypothetical protein
MTASKLGIAGLSPALLHRPARRHLIATTGVAPDGSADLPRNFPPAATGISAVSDSFLLEVD